MGSTLQYSGFESICTLFLNCFNSTVLIMCAIYHALVTKVFKVRSLKTNRSRKWMTLVAVDIISWRNLLKIGGDNYHSIGGGVAKGFIYVPLKFYWGTKSPLRRLSPFSFATLSIINMIICISRLEYPSLNKSKTLYTPAWNVCGSLEGRISRKIVLLQCIYMTLLFWHLSCLKRHKRH